MKKKALAMLLAVVLAVSLLPGTVFAAAAPTEQEVHEAMIALKDEYYEGRPWTNGNTYNWKGGVYSGGGGCVAFAFILSDAAFGSLPARKLTQFEFSDVRVGDILRINNNTHSVIVLEVHDNSVTIAEGNYNSSIHWGRTLTKAEVLKADYMMTRYPLEAAKPEEPDEPAQPTVPTEPEITFPDVAKDAWYVEYVQFAVARGLIKGNDDGTFNPGGLLTRAETFIILGRLAGAASIVDDVKGVNPWYKNAVDWVIANGISDGSRPDDAITREELVEMLYKLANGWTNADASVLAKFPDRADLHDWAEDAMIWAVVAGLIQGNKDDGRLNPRGTATRAETVTMLQRFCNMIGA